VFKEKLHFLLTVTDLVAAAVIESAISKTIHAEFFVATTFKKAEEILNTTKIDVVICNLQLKDGDAIDFLYTLKSQDKKQYSIIISQDKSAYIQNEAYKAGVNDYVLEIDIQNIGFKLKNLSIYIHKNQTIQAADSILIDEEKYAIIKNNQSYFLPAKEFEIVKLFCSSPEKIFTRDEIASHIWKEALVAKSRIIDVHITHIRKVIGKGSIRSIKKVGYGLSTSNV